MQAEKLQHNQKQEEWSRQTGNEEVLQILPEAHTTQRNEVRRNAMADKNTATEAKVEKNDKKPAAKKPAKKAAKK